MSIAKNNVGEAHKLIMDPERQRVEPALAQHQRPRCSFAIYFARTVLCIAARKIINLREFATAVAQKSSCCKKKERSSTPFSSNSNGEAVAAGIARSSSFLAWINHDGIHANSPPTFFFSLKAAASPERTFSHRRERKRREERQKVFKSSALGPWLRWRRGFLARCRDPLKSWPTGTFLINFKM